MNRILLLLCMLLAFLRPGVDGDDDGAVDLDLSGGDDKGDQGGDGADAGDDKGDDPDPAKLAADLATERAERQKDRERAERAERERDEARAAAPRQQHADPLVEEEERVLKDPQATELQKWQVNANREIRAGRAAGQTALAQAQDIADKTSFGQLAVKNPALFKRYESRVEAEYEKTRVAGRPAPREAIMKFLIGQDAMEGKLTKKVPPKQDANPNLNRGRMPGARSDVAGKNPQSDREKRRARLENQLI